MIKCKKKPVKNTGLQREETQYSELTVNRQAERVSEWKEQTGRYTKRPILDRFLQKRDLQ
jgi:hypothetical protein